MYVWADGVYLQARMEDNAECMLVLIGATPEGKKELVGFQTGVRESAQSWRELLIDIKQRGLEIAPDLAVGDGALGFWKAIEEVFPSTRHQRCWVHKTANVLNKVALSVQVHMKADLREIYRAPTRAAAEAAIDVFADKYSGKYDKAVVCLTNDRDALLAFFDFPAEHWDHLRTSNPRERIRDGPSSNRIELRYTPQGTPVCSFSLATNEKRKDKNTGENNDITTWFRVTLWGARQKPLRSTYRVAGRFTLKDVCGSRSGRIETESNVTRWKYTPRTCNSSAAARETNQLRPRPKLQRLRMNRAARRM